MAMTEYLDGPFERHTSFTNSAQPGEHFSHSPGRYPHAVAVEICFGCSLEAFYRFLKLASYAEYFSLKLCSFSLNIAIVPRRRNALGKLRQPQCFDQIARPAPKASDHHQEPLNDRQRRLFIQLEIRFKHHSHSLDISLTFGNLTLKQPESYGVL